MCRGISFPASARSAKTKPPESMPLAPALQRILDEQRAARFSGIAGTSVRYSIPLRENVINAFLVATIGEQDTPARNLRLTLRNDAIEARGIPIISSLTFQLPERIDFPHDPILRLTPTGFMGRLVGTALATFNLAPDFVRFEGGQLRIDIGRLLTSKGQEALLRLLRPVRIHALPGVIWLEGELEASAPVAS